MLHKNDSQNITMKVCTQTTVKNYNEVCTQMTDTNKSESVHTIVSKITLNVCTRMSQKYNEGVHTNDSQKIQ